MLNMELSPMQREVAIDNLEETLSIQSYSGEEGKMIGYIINYLKQVEDYENLTVTTKTESNGINLYVTKGKSKAYPCVVAHTDTVHQIIDDFRVCAIDGKFYGMDTKKMQMAGVGGDDKVGVWAALECISKFDNIKAAFFHSEEQGCIGSSAASADFFDDVAYILQTDRRGNKDFVTEIGGITLMSKKFKKAVKPLLDQHSFEFCDRGGLTDVKALKPKCNVSVTNISSGYYQPHSDEEYVVVSDALNTLSLMINIIDKLGEKKYPHKYEQPVYTYSYDDWYGTYRGKQTSLFQESVNSIASVGADNTVCNQCIGIYEEMVKCGQHQVCISCDVDWFTNLLKDSWGYLYPIYKHRNIVGVYNAEMGEVSPIETVIEDYNATKGEEYWNKATENLLSSVAPF
jgi:tripeptide aminopeptidase